MMGQMLVCAVTNRSDDVLVRMCKVMATSRGWFCVCVHLVHFGAWGWEGRGGRHFGEGGLAIKVISQYCTAHPVLRITKHNRQQNIMAAFLAGKLASEKNGRFGKVWLGK